MSEEDETMFLCGYKRLPRYGTTNGGGNAQQKTAYNRIVMHKVSSTDTLQGVALKYGSSITEIKRLNKLWSNESIYLRDALKIPIYSSAENLQQEKCDENYFSTNSDDIVTASSDISARAASSSSINYSPKGAGHGHSSQSRDPSSTPTSSAGSYRTRTNRIDRHSLSSGSSVDSAAAAGAAANSKKSPSRNKNIENGLVGQMRQQQQSFDKSDMAFSDIFQRIDSAIKTTAKNVNRLEKQSTIEKLISSPDYSSYVSPSSSRQSYEDNVVSSTVAAANRSASSASASPSEVRITMAYKSRNGKSRQPESLQMQDMSQRFYQL